LIDDNMFAIDVKDWGLDDILQEYRSRRLSKMGMKADAPAPFPARNK